MARKGKTEYGARCRTVDLSKAFNYPRGGRKGEFWAKLKGEVLGFPEGEQESWGIPFRMGEGGRDRVVLVAGKRPEVRVPLRGGADYLCFLHDWRQLPDDVDWADPTEGLVVAEYELSYSDGSSEVLPVRARFEVGMAESPGPAWLVQGFSMWHSVDPTDAPEGWDWGRAQTGTTGSWGSPHVCAMANPHPARTLRALTMRGLLASPLIIAGLTLYSGSGHPLRHLPRRHYRVAVPGGSAEVEEADLDLGGVTRLELTKGPPGKRWLNSSAAGLSHVDGVTGEPETLIEAFGAEDATVSVRLSGRKTPLKFSLGEAYQEGSSPDTRGRARLQVLGQKRQWMKVVVTDASTGTPTPVRLHMEGSRGEYVAPYGHHAQINTGWFMDYGADVVAGGRNWAYVPGEFTTDLPVGDLYVELYKGFEYEPTRTKVTVRPGQKELRLKVRRAADWRGRGWVTADTHVHFISPHTAALQAQGEGVNVVNLLASQWGRLFTNVGDIRGRVNVIEDDTLVYVGTENRNHMLGHMSMLGTKGLSVYPMCCGGPGEAYLGDPDFMALAEWAAENKRKGGVVIRPHYPYCGDSEDPVPIIKGLVDALEIGRFAPDSFPMQEWYRYLNCGYRVAVCGGTDKMGAYCPLGWLRTYALTDPDRPFNYGNWARAVRAGRTFSSSGPLIDLTVEGQGIGDTISLKSPGAELEVQATAQSIWPLGRIEVVQNGRVIASERGSSKTNSLTVKCRAKVTGSGWLAARCWGPSRHPASYTAAHTSPVYIQCGDDRPFSGPAAAHMLALVEGTMEYAQTLSTAFDEKSRKRLVKLFNEVRQELQGRLVVEAGHKHHHGRGGYHTHGHGEAAGHTH